MPIDLRFDDEDAEFAAAVGRFCRERAEQEQSTADGHKSYFAPQVWRSLAGLGVLGLGTPEGGGSASSVAAVMEQLGRFFVRGPLVATFAANQLLPQSERAAVAAGDALVGLGSPSLMPWSPLATFHIELDQNRAWLGSLVGSVTTVETLSGEPWGRCDLRRIQDLGPSERAVALSDCALASYLVGAGEALLDSVTEYAKGRSQFGRAIGDFQAIAHPLADGALRLSAAGALVKLAAAALEHWTGQSRPAAAMARLSATDAALHIAQHAHQTFGAMGFAIEGPIGGRSAHIRQLTLLPPAPGEVREAALVGALP